MQTIFPNTSYVLCAIHFISHPSKYQATAFSFGNVRAPFTGRTATELRVAAEEAVTAEAAERAKAVMEAEEMMSNSAGPGIKDNKLMDVGGRPFPLSMIVGQDSISRPCSFRPSTIAWAVW